MNNMKMATIALQLGMITVLPFGAVSLQADVTAPAQLTRASLAACEAAAKSLDKSLGVTGKKAWIDDALWNKECLANSEPTDCVRALEQAVTKTMLGAVGKALKDEHDKVEDQVKVEGERIVRVMDAHKLARERVAASVREWIDDRKLTTPDLKGGRKGAREALEQELAKTAALLPDRVEVSCQKQASRIEASFFGAVAKALAAARDEGRRELRGEADYSRTVNCSWLAADASNSLPRLDCKPGLLINATMAGDILVQPLPGRRIEKVAVGSAEGPWTEETCQTGHAGCEVRRYDKPQASVLIGVYKERAWERGSISKRIKKNCKEGKKNCFRESASVIPLQLDGDSPRLFIIAIDDKEQTAVGIVHIGYERWRVESGGFFALTQLVDDQVVLEADPADATKRRVVKIRDSDSWAQDTGVFLNFIPRNYEWLGGAIGFTASNSSPTSFFLGPTIRLRTFGDRGLASVFGGAVLRSVRRYPDLEPGGSYAAEDKRLEGIDQMKTGWFLGIQLGFSFGPISAGE